MLLSPLSACQKTVEELVAKPTSPLDRAKATINEQDYRSHINTLASDAFGGRGLASPGEDLTIRYLLDQFKSMGLAPGNGDSYTQNVPLAWVRVMNEPSLTISNEQGEVLEFSYGDDQVIWTRRQSGGSDLSNSDLVFVGYGINAPERNWNDYAGIDVKGKTVIILVNDPGYATQDPTVFNGNAMTYYGRWDYKFDEAAKQGASAAIIIHDTKPAAYPWNTVQNSWTGKQFDMVRPGNGDEFSAVEGWIQRDKASKVFAKAGLNIDDMYLKAKTPGFKAIPMDLQASTTIETTSAGVISRNVAALLKGSEASDEVFIYMAHWDHLGTDESIEGDGIYNGASDNATGIAGLLALAKAFSKLEQAPRRSVLFVALTGEEQGLLGSAYYAANPLHPLASTVGGINMDGINSFGPTKDITVVGYNMSELDHYLMAAAKKQNRVLIPDPTPEKGYYYRSDHFELAKLGVPMLYPNMGMDHREKGIEYIKAKKEDYLANRYHRVSDEYSPNWDVSGAIEDLQIYFTTGLNIANDSTWPNWLEGTEFKATRDASRSD